MRSLTWSASAIVADFHAAEETQLHDLARARINRREPVQRGVERDEVGLRRAVGGQFDALGLGQRHALLLGAAAALGGAGAGVVHEDAAHGARGHVVKVDAALPGHGLDIDQAQVSLVDQGGRAERVAAALAAHVLARQRAQMLVDQRHQTLGGVRVALVPGQAGDGSRRGLNPYS